MNLERTRASLIHRVRCLNDEQSWNEFVALYGPVILRYLRRIGVNEQDSVDLAQDVLQLVVRNIGHFEYDANRSFRAWLRTIATHRAYRFFKQKTRRPVASGGSVHAEILHEIPTDERELDELIENEWRTRRLELAMKKVRTQVKARTWEVFELVDLKGKPVAEVAQRLNMAVGTIHTSLCRVRAKLRSAVEEIDE